MLCSENRNLEFGTYGLTLASIFVTKVRKGAFGDGRKLSLQETAFPAWWCVVWLAT